MKAINKPVPGFPLNLSAHCLLNHARGQWEVQSGLGFEVLPLNVGLKIVRVEKWEEMARINHSSRGTSSLLFLFDFLFSKATVLPTTLLQKYRI